ncbi:MAG TPA: DUF485 domain-containing protein, partial [Solirubrobacterales bacterium]|nr:DUF485 domain-containing protein [Solirubrobacterales bacterium]
MPDGQSAGEHHARERHETFDWVAAERSDEFRELVRKRRRFVVPATIFFLAWYVAFILLAGYAPRFMGQSIYQGLTVGYVLALTQFPMVWILGGLYLRRADRDFDPLARRTAEKALEVGSGVARTRECTDGDGGSRSGAGRPAHGRRGPRAMTAVLAQAGSGRFNRLAFIIACCVLAVTLGITYWASKRTRTATDFWAAGRGITGAQNGFAISGDYMSAASFLGIAGLI